MVYNKIFGRRKKSQLIRALKELAIFGLGMVILVALFSYWLDAIPQSQFDQDMLRSQQIGWERQAHFRAMRQEHGDRFLMRATNQ